VIGSFIVDTFLTWSGRPIRTIAGRLAGRYWILRAALLTFSTFAFETMAFVHTGGRRFLAVLNVVVNNAAGRS